MPYADPGVKKAHDAAYGKAHRGEAREAQRRHRLAHPEKSAEYTAKWKYGITSEEYDRLFVEQGGLCAVCRQPETARDRLGRVRARLSVDHNHKTGAVRGLLCHHCNAALGHVNDDIELLRALMAYLETRP